MRTVVGVGATRGEDDARRCRGGLGGSTSESAPRPALAGAAVVHDENTAGPGGAPSWPPPTQIRPMWTTPGAYEGGSWGERGGLRRASVTPFVMHNPSDMNHSPTRAG